MRDQYEEKINELKEVLADLMDIPPEVSEIVKNSPPLFEKRSSKDYSHQVLPPMILRDGRWVERDREPSHGAC